MDRIKYNEEKLKEQEIAINLLEGRKNELENDIKNRALENFWFSVNHDELSNFHQNLLRNKISKYYKKETEGKSPKTIPKRKDMLEKDIKENFPNIENHILQNIEKKPLDIFRDFENLVKEKGKEKGKERK